MLIVKVQKINQTRSYIKILTTMELEWIST
jgi:hypothetical protein